MIYVKYMYFAINTCNDANDSKTDILLYAVTFQRLIFEVLTYIYIYIRNLLTDHRHNFS